MHEDGQLGSGSRSELLAAMGVGSSSPMGAAAPQEGRLRGAHGLGAGDGKAALAHTCPSGEEEEPVVRGGSLPLTAPGPLKVTESS